MLLIVPGLVSRVSEIFLLTQREGLGRNHGKTKRSKKFLIPKRHRLAFVCIVHVIELSWLYTKMHELWAEDSLRVTLWQDSLVSTVPPEPSHSWSVGASLSSDLQKHYKHAVRQLWTPSSLPCCSLQHPDTWSCPDTGNPVLTWDLSLLTQWVLLDWKHWLLELVLPTHDLRNKDIRVTSMYFMPAHTYVHEHSHSSSFCFVLFFVFWFFGFVFSETGFPCVALAILELTP